MYTIMPHHKRDTLYAQINALRTQLEHAALSCPEKALTLSRELDALMNQLMLSREKQLRRHLSVSAADLHVYCASAMPRHAIKRRETVISRAQLAR